MSYRAVLVSKFGGPEVCEVGEVKERSLSEDEVLVRVEAVGVNPVDTYIRSGTYVRKPALPYTPGSDGSGVIEKLGKECTPWKIGDRVYLSGTQTGSYAEKAVCKVSQIHKLPENVSFAQGAGLFVPYATAYSALFHHARALPGETVLIHGASGGVGIAAMQFAVARGLRVLGTASSKEGLEIIEKMGGEAFNHREEGYEQKILDATQQQGANVILEMLSNVNLQKDISLLLSRFGRVVVIGCRGSIEINPRALMGKSSCIMGMALANSNETEFKEIYAAIDAGLSNGSLSPVVSNYSFSLDSAKEAHIHVIERPSGTIGKVVLYTKEK